MVTFMLVIVVVSKADMAMISASTERAVSMNFCGVTSVPRS